MAGSGPALAAVTCTVNSVSLPFGTYNDASASPTNVSTTFTISCCRTGAGGNTVVTVSANNGLNSGTANPRAMKNPANTDLMNYSLSTVSFGGAVWGNGSNGGSVFSTTINVNRTCASGNRNTASPTVFGQIPALQAVSATLPLQPYTDTVTMTVSP